MKGFLALLARIRKFFKKNADTKRDIAIDKAQKEQRKLQEKVFKILLLGTGESGKSTVFKQMMFLYGTQKENSVTEAVKKNSATLCFNALIAETQTIIKALTKEERVAIGIPEEFPTLSEEGLKAAEFLLSFSGSQTHATPESAVAELEKIGVQAGFTVQSGLNAETVAAIKQIWNETAVQMIWNDYRSKLQVSNSWGYFAKVASEEFPKWGGPGWIPTDEEYLLVRVRTTGVKECSFSVNDITHQKAKKKKSDGDKAEYYPKILIIDVGGQKSERKKWVNAFDGMPMVLYVVASSEYDQVMFDDLSTNRLTDSLKTFKSVANDKAFTSSSFILFLNKADLLKKKLCEDKVPLNISGEFEDAPKGFDFDEATSWLRSKYEDRMPKKDNGTLRNSLFVHVTTATDKENAKKILDSLVSSVIENELGYLLP